MRDALRITGPAHSRSGRRGLSRLSLATMALAGGVLAGCALHPVGPDYELPRDAVMNSQGALAPLAGASEPGGPYSQESLPDHWWQLFQDEKLDRLIQEAFDHNTDLRVAQANLERAQTDIDVTAGGKKVQAGISGGPSYGHGLGLVDDLTPGERPSSTWNYLVTAHLSYDLDLTGQIDRALEAGEANRDAVEAARDLVRVNVAGATAQAYASVCSVGLQLKSLSRSRQLQHESLVLTQRLHEAGRAGITDISRAQAQLDRLDAAKPPLEAQRQRALYQLATLTGHVPQDFPKDLASCDTPPHVAGLIPVGDGAGLLRRRPDVRAAEHQLAAATARIGVATAELYPHISFGLSGTSESLLKDFGGRDSNAYNVGPIISWTIPNTGAIQARIRGEQASTKAAFAHFDGVVLTALRETESALASYSKELERHAALVSARDQDATVERQATQLYQSGRTGYLSALDAQRTLAADEQTLAASDASLADMQVRLFMTLGGGWQQDAAREKAAAAAQVAAEAASAASAPPVDQAAVQTYPIKGH